MALGCLPCLGLLGTDKAYFLSVSAKEMDDSLCMVTWAHIQPLWWVIKEQMGCRTCVCRTSAWTPRNISPREQQLGLFVAVCALLNAVRNLASFSLHQVKWFGTMVLWFHVTPIQTFCSCLEEYTFYIYIQFSLTFLLQMLAMIMVNLSDDSIWVFRFYNYMLCPMVWFIFGELLVNFAAVFSCLVSCWKGVVQFRGKRQYKAAYINHFSFPLSNPWVLKKMLRYPF